MRTYEAKDGAGVFDDGTFPVAVVLKANSELTCAVMEIVLADKMRVQQTT